MANRVITPDIIAREAAMILENELVFGNAVYRGYEDEFSKSVNGYKVGDTISIRKPAQFTVRDGAVASVQDVTEGKHTFTVNKQKGVDFKFQASDLDLKISDLSERIIKPALIPLINQIDQDVAALALDVPNYVGTPGTLISAFSHVAAAASRLDELAVPTDSRTTLLSPADHWAVAGAQTALYMQDVAKTAYRTGKIGNIADTDAYRSQNVATLTTGARGGTPLVNGGSQAVTYDTVKDTGRVGGIQSLITDGWTAAAATRVKKGEVFTIAGVYAINPVTKVALPFLQQFVVTADAASDASGNATLSISPAIIVSGAFQTVSAAPADNAALTFIGAASTAYRQNVTFHKNAFGLVMVPMQSPPGAVDVSRQSYKGVRVRVIPYYDGTNDVSFWRLDVLYGVKTLDERLACRLAGS